MYKKTGRDLYFLFNKKWFNEGVTSPEIGTNWVKKKNSSVDYTKVDAVLETFPIVVMINLVLIISHDCCLLVDDLKDHPEA